MKLLTPLSIFLGLALIAGAIHYKPSLACISKEAVGYCHILEGKILRTIDYGDIEILNLKNGKYATYEKQPTN